MCAWVSMHMETCTYMKINPRQQRGQEEQQTIFITHLPLPLYGLILRLFNRPKILPLGICWIIEMVSQHERPCLYHFEISKNTLHIQLRKITCLKNNIMYIPLSAIHVRVPHKIFSSLKLLNPWLSLQNPRRWTTATSRTSICNMIALHMSRITFFFQNNRNKIESYSLV